VELWGGWASAELGGDKQTIWDEIARVQNAKALSSSVDEKAKHLRSVVERGAEVARASSSWRTEVILAALAALSLITVGIAIVDNFHGQLLSQRADLWVRLLPVVVGVVATIALMAWLVVRRRAGTRQRSRRKADDDRVSW
jgi:hypothetical protein